MARIACMIFVGRARMTMPTVSVDGEVLAALSIGTQIGCLIYAAWRTPATTTNKPHQVRRRPGSRGRRHLSLIAFDIAWDRQALDVDTGRSRVAQPEPAT
jgi:hypothetical protein